MTRNAQDIIDDMRNIVKPRIAKMLLEANFEGCGKEDKAEFETEFEVLLTLAERSATVEPQEWISVKDRIPESRDLVLVTAYWHERHQVMMASYFGNGEWWCVPFNNCGEHMQKLKPIAWMPLLSPYKGDKE